MLELASGQRSPHDNRLDNRARLSAPLLAVQSGAGLDLKQFLPVFSLQLPDKISRYFQIFNFKLTTLEDSCRVSLACVPSVGESVPKAKKMTADSQKKSHPHHYHHHQHPHKKMVHIKSLERLTNLPVVESAHAYYEKIKVSFSQIH